MGFHRRSTPSLALAVLCIVASVAACGSKSGSHTSTGSSSEPSSSSSSGSTASGLGGSGSSTGSSMGGGVNFGDGGQDQTLTITPAAASIVINSKTTPATESFTVSLGGVPVGTATWTLDSYAQGSISSAGLFTTSGLVGGLVHLTATYGTYTATAELAVNVALSETVMQGSSDPGPSSANQTALMGAPMADPGATASPPNPTTILYPYNKTVMPRGLVAPLLQFSPGNLPPEDALVALTSKYFSWQGFIHVSNATTPQFSIPQAIWDGALLSTGGESLTISVTKAAQGIAYGPATTGIFVAPGSLTGAVYYMTYDTATAPGMTGTVQGLYSVLPGVQQPAKLIVPGCLVCHSVSANGTRLALGTDDATLTAQSGIYNVGSDGTATQVTQSPAGLGGDSRGISYATFTPDGRYVLRSQNDFWGGVNQQAWRIDDVNMALVPSTVVGLGPTVSAYLPSISPDGKHYAFTNGMGDPFGTTGRSISLMDLSIDTTSDTLTFANRQLLLDNGASGSVAKFTTFMPDSASIVLEEGQNFCASYGEMLPTWSTSCSDYSFTGSTGRLFRIDTTTKEHIELANLNAGNVAVDADRNYEPFALPVTAGGYFWVVFTSIREYGNTYQGANVQKQLWVAAISTNPASGTDPSHPPFYLPNQSATRNERGFWALQPCQADGTSCVTGDQCCDGFCRPSNPNDPGSATVCSMPTSGACSQISEKCTADADCCGASSGITCIGGFCTQPSPQ